MRIEDIIYDTTREVFNLEGKLSIATIFIFCWKLSSYHFAKLLYSENSENFIEELQKEFDKYDIILQVDFSNPNISNAFHKTLDAVKKQYDTDGFYKALFDGDEFAVEIDKMINNKLIKSI